MVSVWGGLVREDIPYERNRQAAFLPLAAKASTT